MYILSTERCILREFSPTDAAVLFDLNSNSNVVRYTGDVAFDSVEATRKFIQNYSDYEKNGFGRWLVIEKNSKVVLGWCGLKYYDNEVDIGYRFFEHFWGKGFATETARACLDYGFNVLNLQRIVGNCMLENTASIRVLEKLGMQRLQEKNLADAPGVQYVITNTQFNEQTRNL